MASGPELLALRSATLGHGPTPVLKEANLSIAKGDRLCLVGRNGSGKSTLLSSLLGVLDLDKGSRYIMPGITIASLPQDPAVPEGMSVLDFATQDGAEEYRALAMLYALGLNPEDNANTLSGGQIRRASLAAALALDPDILLLDEPTNHLDLPSIEWLEKELSNFKGGLLVISHDRAFLKRVTTGILWLDRQMIRRLDAPFDKFDDWVDEVMTAEEAEMERINQHIKQEQRYLLRGVTARRKRNVRRLEKLADLKVTKSQMARNDSDADLSLQDVNQSGKIVMEAKNLSKSYGEKVIADDLSLRILRGDRIGIIGPNGAGKTTLINMLIGRETPDGGDIRIGTNLDVAWFDQRREQLDVNKSPWDIIGNGTDQVTIGERNQHVMGYLKRFNFTEAQARGKVSILSGGEKNRLMLAQILSRPCNLMILDEPTNDLDMETLDLLEDMLSEFGGTLIIVSHDRDFLDRLVGTIIAVEGEGKVEEYAGGYSDYYRHKQAILEEEKQAQKAGAISTTQSKDAPKSGKKTQKLSYKDQRDLDRLPGLIDEIQDKIGKMDNELADANLFTKNPDRFQFCVDERARLAEELDKSEERWLELEMLQEELSAG